jgi:glutamate carboxypeptidase
MNPSDAAILAWIDAQAGAMTQRLIDWAQINTYSTHLAGLDRFRALLLREFNALGGQATEVDLQPAESIDEHGQVIRTPLAKALRVVKRPQAPRRVFLCIHMDTVYPPQHPFQSCTRLDEATLQGPGVADAKGGLVVLLTALAALERSDSAGRLGWEVLINPDEEIGSSGSAPLLTEAAGRNQMGLLFEPALPDGSLVDRRKGSGNFVAVLHGRAAHAGRDFAAGRNAIVAAAALAVGLDDLNGKLSGVTVNIGRIDGGGPANVVPDLAVVRCNVRCQTPDEQRQIEQRIQTLIAEFNRRDGITVELHGGFHSPPKAPDAAGAALMQLIERCGREMNLGIRWQSSGGTCDGNKLAAAGLANVDSLGPCGANLHSPRELVQLGTLTERAKLTALILLRWSQGEQPGPK